MLPLKKAAYEPMLETGEPDIVDQETFLKKNAAPASGWMLGLTMLLFFLPVFNGIVGGIIGGYKMGSTKFAVMASLLPATAATFLLWIAYSIVNPAFLGVVSEWRSGVLIILSALALILGAAIGGTIAQNKVDRLNRA